MESRVDVLLMDYINDVFQYMLYCTSSSEIEVATIASDFWGIVAKNDSCQQTVLAYLDQFVVYFSLF